MPTAQHLRAQIEANLAEKIPSALTPLPRLSSLLMPTGVPEVDALLQGGLPVGAISEIVGPESSGRTSLALALVAGMTQAGKVCAWVDISDALHPESAAAIGVDLSRLLWIRCGGVPASVSLPPSPVHKLRTAEKGLPPSAGSHPRMEAKGLSTAVSDLLGSTPRRVEAQRKPRPEPSNQGPQLAPGTKLSPRRKTWSRLEQGLRVTDLLLQAGGFSCIVLDMGSLNAEYALRIPLATWFRFRAASERLQSNLVLLTQHACSRNSAGLVLHLEAGQVLTHDSTIFTGLEHRAELARRRFPQGNVLPLRKQPQSVQSAAWHSTTAWAESRGR